MKIIVLVYSAIMFVAGLVMGYNIWGDHKDDH